MKKLTMREIIRFGIKIEKESFQFYTNAAKRVADRDTRSLTAELASQELDHLNKLKSLNKERKMTEGDLQREWNVDDTFVENIIVTRDIQKGAGSQEILQIALEREKKTKENYEMFLTLSPMNEKVKNAFRELKEMEEDHMEMITERIKRLIKTG
jgi:rubrerythrin